MAGSRVSSRSADFMKFLLYLGAFIATYVFSGLVNDSVPSMDHPSLGYRVTTDFWDEIYGTTNRWAGRHLERRCIRKKHFLKSKLSYCSKSASHFQLARLATSGDINPNPSPTVVNKNSTKCPVCGRVPAKNHPAITCGSCCHRTHIKCSGLTPIELKQLHLFLELPTMLTSIATTTIR